MIYDKVARRFLCRNERAMLSKLVQSLLGCDLTREKLIF